MGDMADDFMYGGRCAQEEDVIDTAYNNDYPKLKLRMSRERCPKGVLR